jgi:DNA-binding transcriptional LysR family regulator
MSRRPYYKDLRIEHFRTFCEVARLGSFAATAAGIGLSRTTVWQQVETLERKLNVKLFRRRKRGVELTEEGAALLELAQPPVSAFETLHDAFQERLKTQGAILRIATVHGTEVFLASHEFRRHFANARITFFERRSPEVVQMVVDGDCDLGFCPYPATMTKSPTIHFEQVGTREVTLIAPAEHPLACKRRFDLAELVDYPLIMAPADNPWRKPVDRVFDHHGLTDQVRVVVESNSLETHERCVSLGLGVSIAAPGVRYVPCSGLVRRSLSAFFGAIPFFALWKKGAYLLPQASLFVERVKQHCGK